ncbi:MULTISPECIES: HNH endonuclease signature motif containing protein, partial [Arthrobacter]
MEAESSTSGVPGAGQVPGFTGAPGDSGVLGSLSALTSAIVAADRGIAQLQAGRELLLAMAVELSHGLIDDDGAAGPGGDPFGAARAVELAERSVAAEIATATRTSDRAIQHQMGAAVELVERFPATLQAFSQGRISAAHVRVIRDAGTVIEDPAARARYEAAVLPVAEVQAPGRVRRHAAREAEKAQPEPLNIRHERACEQRRVWLNPLPDGMAELGAVLPATLAHGVFGRLTTLAKVREETASGADTAESRTRDQLRADLLSDLLLHGAPSGHDTPDGLLAGISARVEVTVPVLTLIGDETHEPVAAELNGRHPIDPDTARLLAGGVSAWNRVLTDPISGAVLAVDRYRPSEDLQRLLHARDSRCRFPGCNLPANELDLDHTQDAAHGGPTTLGNLAGLCRRHHVLKHHTRWSVKQAGP